MRQLTVETIYDEAAGHNAMSLVSRTQMPTLVIRMILSKGAERAILTVMSDGHAPGRSVRASRRGLWDGHQTNPFVLCGSPSDTLIWEGATRILTRIGS